MKCVTCKTTIASIMDLGAIGNRGSYCKRCEQLHKEKESALITEHINRHQETPTGFSLRYLRMIAWGADQA